MKGVDVKERIKTAGYTLKQVADRMGVSPQALQNILKAEDIKVGVLQNIAEAINKSVYFFFEDMLDETKSASKPEPLNHTIAPLITQYAYGGYMSGFGDAGYMEAQPLYVASKKYSGGNYVAFEVRGDSMDDNTRRAICSGDVVLGRELYKEYWTSKLHIPRVFIIVHKTEGICIKEVTAHKVKEGIITCHSFNPDYDDFEVNLKEVMQLFYLKEIKRETENGY
jgi:transcriptional regulator with XRE-family HTH domain